MPETSIPHTDSSTEDGWVITNGHRLNNAPDGGQTVYCQWACKDVPLTEFSDELVCSGCDRPAVIRKSAQARQS